MSFQLTPFFYPTKPPKLSLESDLQIPHDAKSPTAHLNNSSRHPLPQRARQRRIRLRPHLDIPILLHQKIAHQPPKHHTPPFIQMGPVVGQVVVRPAGFRPDRVDVVRAGAVEIDRARSRFSQSRGDGQRGVALGREVLDHARRRQGVVEGAAGEGGDEDGSCAQGEDFRGESVQVCGEGGEGDVFGGFLVVVAELGKGKDGGLVSSAFWRGSSLFVTGWEMRFYLDRHEDVVRLGVALDLVQHGGPVAAFAERYCCCAAVA